MFEDRETKIARAVRAGPAGPASSRAYVSLVTFFAPKKVTNHDAPLLSATNTEVIYPPPPTAIL